jgi:PAS domain S-box-containing protein
MPIAPYQQDFTHANFLGRLSQWSRYAQPYPEDKDQAARLRAQQLRVLARLAPVTLPALMLGALAMVSVLFELAPRFLMGWAALICALTFISMARVRANKDIEQASPRNLMAGTWVVVLFACLWGALPLALLGSIGQQERLMLIFAMVCMTSAGGVVFHMLPLGGLAWVLILTTSTVTPMVMDGTSHAWVLAGMAVAYASVMIRSIRDTAHLFFARWLMVARAEALARDLARQAQIAHSTSNAITVLDLDGCVTWVNDGFSKSTGHSLDDVRGQHFTSLLQQEDQVEALGAVWEHLRQQHFHQGEMLYRRKDGHLSWVQVDAKALRDDAGDLSGYMIVGTDISAIKRGEVALQAERARLGQIVEGTHCGTWEVEFSTGEWQLGGRWEDIIGLDASALVKFHQFTVMGAMHPDDKEGAAQALRAYLKGEVNCYSFEHRLRHHDGHWRWVISRAKASAVNAQGRIERLAGISMEITARKNMELALTRAMTLAEQANQAKSAFLAAMSHEIRTPMNGVIGTAEWLQHTGLNDTQRDGVKTIVDSGRALLTIIDDILDFSKVEAGRMALERGCVNLVDLVEGVGDALDPVAQSKGVDLHLFVDPTLPSHIVGDAMRLRQVLFNLAGNAVKFSAGRQHLKGHVQVRVSPDEPSSARLKIEILDNGIGMSAETLDKLFEPFSQAEASTTRRFGGTGLGLAISRRLVELMGGCIDAESQPGQGSLFRVSLPMALPEDHPGVQPWPDLHGVGCFVLPGSNYVADDVAAYLRHAGAMVTAVNNPAQANELAMRLDGSVVIHDDTGAQDAELAAMQVGFMCTEWIRHLIIAADRRGPATVVAPTVGRLGRAHHQDLLRAVAMVAGRRSPDLIAHEDIEAELLAQAMGEGAVQANPGGKHLILIAEDDSTNQKVIARQMALLGYAAEMACDGAQALARWRSGRYALLLSDLHMPAMDGYELAAAIRDEEAAQGLARMPIVALTANALKGEDARARAAGMDEYLTKPIQLKDLKRCLTQWLPVEVAEPKAVDPAVPLTSVTEGRSISPQLVGDDEEVVLELLRDFEASSTKLGLALREAAAAKAPERVRQLAHQLKSAARSVGAIALGELCATLEQSAKNDEASIWPMDELTHELEAVHLSLELMLREPV